jgi:CubicO group peptidase (beta-lactamase class C family)
MIRRVLLSALAAAVPFAPAQAAPEPTLAERVRTAHRSASPAAPALAAVRVRCGAEPETAVVGRARADRPNAVLAQGRFNIGSNAKSVLASLAATFVQQGRLRWDTTVAEVFRDEAATLDPTLRGATLAQLLSHRSGLDAYTSGKALEAVEVRGAEPVERRLSFALHVLRAEPAYAPGSATVYSNAGYVVAGAMLERIGGAAVRVSWRRSACSGRSECARSSGRGWRRAGAAVGACLAGEGPRRDRTGDPRLPAARGRRVPLDARLRPLSARAPLRPSGGKTRVLKPATARFLHAPQADGEAALGWGRFTSAAGSASTHVGGTGAFASYVAVVPGRNFAVAAGVNSGSDEAGAAARALLLELIAAEARRPQSRIGEEAPGTQKRTP